MSLTITYLIAYICEALILFQYSCSVFETKRELPFNIGILSLCYSIMFAASFLQNSLLNTINFFFFNALYIQLVYISHWYFTLFNSLIITISMSLSELFAACIFPQAVYNFQIQINIHFMIVFGLISKLLFLFILNIIEKIFSSFKKKNTSHGTDTLLLTIISLIIFCTMLSFMFVCQYVELPNRIRLIITISTVLLFFLNFIVTWFYNDVQKKNREYLQLQMQLQKESDIAEYHQALLKEDENQKILIHDIRRHLMAIANLNENGGTKEVADYIKRLTQSSDLQTASRVCDNPLLNSMLGRYMRQCRDEQIAFQPDIRNHSIDFLSDEHLTALFCNLMDNAVSAAASSTARYIELSVTKKEDSSFTLISLINSCDQNPFSPTGKLPSNKPHPQWHGYGLKSIERIAVYYHGATQFYYDEKTRTFHTIITLYKKPPFHS